MSSLSGGTKVPPLRTTPCRAASEAHADAKLHLSRELRRCGDHEGRGRAVARRRHEVGTVHHVEDVVEQVDAIHASVERNLIAERRIDQQRTGTFEPVDY